MTWSPQSVYEYKMRDRFLLIFFILFYTNKHQLMQIPENITTNYLRLSIQMYGKWASLIVHELLRSNQYEYWDINSERTAAVPPSHLHIKVPPYSALWWHLAVISKAGFWTFNDFLNMQINPFNKFFRECQWKHTQTMCGPLNAHWYYTRTSERWDSNFMKDVPCCS